MAKARAFAEISADLLHKSKPESFECVSWAHKSAAGGNLNCPPLASEMPLVWMAGARVEIEASGQVPRVNGQQLIGWTSCDLVCMKITPPIQFAGRT